MSFLTVRGCVKIVYARVSTDDENLALEHDALKKAGCKKIIDDKQSGAASRRPGLTSLMEGDQVVVWKLDRLGESLRDLIDLVSKLEDNGVGFSSLQEKIDTASSGGRLTFHIFGALAEFERALIRERTHAGLTAARKRGRGRPKALSEKQQRMLINLYDSKRHSIAEICDALKISKLTLYSYLQNRPAAPATVKKSRHTPAKKRL
jgi:DNA invertase Pin-like site-specific DNA recombinase